MKKKTTETGERFVCVHGHFYQPPREHPWLEIVETQESARPYHDWNERIAAECYAPNAEARILQEDGRTSRVVNNYARMSFNFGPTLLAWLEPHRADVYRAVLEADRESARRFGGHGSALAQAYGHAILPLCNERDKATQVAWGVADFRYRFGREPEGMWLPETAVDTASLEALAAAGIRFTVLAPGQAAGRIDPRRPYRVELPSGRSIAVFFYDGAISAAIAFENLLTSGDQLARRLRRAHNRKPGAQLVHVATDGETYGHHHKFGDMALAWALDALERDPEVRLTNYGQFLELAPPRETCRLVEPSAWSCAHGVGRWSTDCGCETGAHPEWHQRWRKPLRAALDWLRDDVNPRFERAASERLHDPWAARDDWIEVILDRTRFDAFVARHGRGRLDRRARRQTAELLELQRNLLLMYTSCAWFFDEVSGIEATQVLRYAARAAQLAEVCFDRPFGAELADRLEPAESNLRRYRSARRVFLDHARSDEVDLNRFAANFAVAEAFGEDLATPAYRAREVSRREATHDGTRIVTGRLSVASNVTFEEETVVYTLLDPGDHTLTVGVRAATGEHAEAPEPVDLRERYGRSVFSLQDLSRDNQRRIVARIVEATRAEARRAHEDLFRRHASLLRFLTVLDTPAPPELLVAARVVFQARLVRAFNEEPVHLERLNVLLAEAEELGVDLDGEEIGLAARQAVERGVASLAPESAPRLAALIARVRRLPFAVDLRAAENAVARDPDRHPELASALEGS